VDGTDSGSCPMVGFCISTDELQGFATDCKLVSNVSTLLVLKRKCNAFFGDQGYQQGMNF